MALPRCRHLRLRNVPVLRMLQLEEALFRAEDERFCPTVIHFGAAGGSAGGAA